MKTLRIILGIAITFALTCNFAFGESVRGKKDFRDPVTFQKKATVKEKMEFGKDASITIESSQTVPEKNLYPQNFIKNSGMDIWSGGTRWGSGALSSVPDGWYIPSTSTYTGVTRIDVDTISPVSSVTPDFTNSVYLGVFDTANAISQTGNTKFFMYPGSGVSTASSWYKRFAGKSVTFGAYVKRDLGQYTSTGVTTNFIRPVMNDHSVFLSGVTNGYWKEGDWVSHNGWNLYTVTWDVPTTADAFEVGFAMNPTVLSPAASTGDSVYITGAFLEINPLHKGYVPIPEEDVYFTNQIDVFGSGGSTFGAGPAQALDLSSDNGWGGKVPDNVTAIYGTVEVNAAYPNGLHMYGDNSSGGVTFFGTGSGAFPQATTAWIPVSSSGTINISTVPAAFSGTSLFVHGAKLR